MTWHTDKKIGEVATLPNGTKVRVVSIRGRRVRLEFLDPPKNAVVATAAPSEQPAGHGQPAPAPGPVPAPGHGGAR